MRGRPFYFTHNALRETLENNMNPSLEVHIRKTTTGEVEFGDWIEAVKIEDEFVARDRKEAKEMIAKEISWSEREKAKNAPARPKYSSTTATSQPGPSKGTTSLPKLTPAERAIIFDHQGCFKCRQLYVDHKGADCPNGFPPPRLIQTTNH